MLQEVIHRENIYDAKAALTSLKGASPPGVAAARGFAASAV